MAHLPEESKFDEGVYQLEMTDPVVGGPNGISNSPLRNLANRTRWLKDQLATALTAKADKESPQLTGEPTTTEPGDNDNSTRIASTGWVRSLVTRLAAPLAHVGSRGAAHGEATTSEAGFMSAADKAKLNGIAAGAQGNTVTSVAGKTGAVTLAVADVSGALASSHAGAGGTAHALATSSQAGFMSAADKRKLDTVSAGAGAGAVTSVAGRTGAVTLAVADVSGAAPKTSPTFSGTLSVATNTQIDFDETGTKVFVPTKSLASSNTGATEAASKQAVVDYAAPKVNPAFSGRISVAEGTVTDLNHERGAKVYVPAKKVGDMTAPEAVSKYALQDYAAPIASPTFTGTPRAPKAGSSNRSSQIATTEWVADHALDVIRNRESALYSVHSSHDHMAAQMLGMGGVRIQAGNAVIQSDSWFNFPHAFPRKCVAVIACDGGHAALAVSAAEITRTGFRLKPPHGISNIGIRTNWLAIGF